MRLLLVDGGRDARESLGTKAFSGLDDPFAAMRETLWTGPDGMAIGKISFHDTMSINSFPHVEVLIVASGQLTLAEPGKPPLNLSPGSGSVISPGTCLTITAAAGTSCIFAANSGASSAMPGLAFLDAGAHLMPSAAPAAELLIGPSPKCRSANVFHDEAAQLRAGTWDSTPYRRIARPHPVNELMMIIDGSTTLTTADGRTFLVGEGDAAFIPKGVDCAWHSATHVSKFYVVQNA